MTDKSRECRYNTSTNPSFVGYCDHPIHHYNGGWVLVECQGCPCPDWKPEEKEDED